LNADGKANLATETFSELPTQRFSGDERPTVIDETGIDADWELFHHGSMKCGLFIPP
jgi:hypothetical protein